MSVLRSQDLAENKKEEGERWGIGDWGLMQASGKQVPALKDDVKERIPGMLPPVDGRPQPEALGQARAHMWQFYNATSHLLLQDSFLNAQDPRGIQRVSRDKRLFFLSVECPVCSARF